MNMRLKIKEYINELDEEIDKCTRVVEKNLNKWDDKKISAMEVKLTTLNDVRNDLQGRLDELI